MRVDWLSLIGFRSYVNLEWRPDPGVNVLTGPNGAGKTNVLEAIAYLAALRSFRSSPETALIGDEAEEAVVRSGIAGAERRRLIEIEIRREGRRRAQVDKSALRRASDLLGVLRVVAFLPDDLDFVKRGAAHRRDLLDDVAVQLWPAAYLDQLELERSLRQRNAFLKAGDTDQAVLAVWDSRLAHAAGRVIARRWKVMKTLGPHLAESYADIAGDGAVADFTYTCSWADGELKRASAGEYADTVNEALEVSHRRDYERRMTTVGPHRDEPGFVIDGRDARAYGSQGEQRTMALAVKLSAHRAIAEAVGEPPVLLLDDVFSELDPARSEALAEALPSEAQTIITSARPEDVPVAGRSWSAAPGTLRWGAPGTLR